MTDKIMAIMALATLIAFLVTVVWFVPDKDLMAVIAFVSVLATYDFWRAFHEGQDNGGNK